jgi:hypothetical protein
MTNIIIREDWSGQRGGRYYYVKEGNILRRIEKYAISKKEIYESSRGIGVEYAVPVDRLRDKIIYEFSFSNKGYFYPKKCTVEAFLNPQYPDSPWIPNFALTQSIDVNELEGLMFEAEDPMLLKILRDIRENYTLMINEIKKYSELMGFDIAFGGHAELTRTFFDNIYEGLIRCMILQNDKARLKALEKPLAWIYQLWITMLACKSLGINNFLKEEYLSKPVWWIEQGKTRPAFIARAGINYYTFFFEPQFHEGAHLVGMFTVRRVHVRPDIIVAKGHYESINSAKVDLLIECKTLPTEMWEEDIMSQIDDYIALYKPQTIMLVSLYKVEYSLKNKLIQRGIICIDEVTPGSVNVETFKRYIQRILV